MEWQPIETAPKNFFVFLYCPKDDSRWLAKWQGDRWYGVDDCGLTRETLPDEYDPCWRVTHWMLLPEPPKGA